VTAVLVDSNVILDLVERDPRWLSWSATTLARLADQAVLVINPIIYAEVAIGFDGPEDVEARCPPAPTAASLFLTRPPLPLAKRSSPTAGAAVPGARRCLTSTSVRMRRSAATDC
jgi:hypothetical protein